MLIRGSSWRRLEGGCLARDGKLVFILYKEFNLGNERLEMMDIVGEII